MTAPAVGHEKRRVLILASTSYLGHQLYDQRIARAIAATGREVHYIEPAVPLVRGRWHRESSLEVRWTAPDGMRIVTPRMVPLGRRVPLAAITSFLVSLQLKLLLPTLRRETTSVLICAAHPTLVRSFRRLIRVALFKDDYVEAGGLTGQSARTVLRRRRSLTRAVDHVVAVSPYLAQLLLREGSRALVIPAGCDPVAKNNEEAASLSGVARPRAVFSGMLSDRIDFPLMTELVDAGFSIVFAGRQQYRFTRQADYDRLMASGGVVELGELDQPELERVLTSCDVGLVPYTQTKFNAASFPLKTLEYLAAGLPVVATALPSILWLDDPHIHVVDDVGKAARVALEAGASARSELVRDECRATAARHSWQRRAASFLALLEPTSSL